MSSGGLGTTGGYAELAVIPAASARSIPEQVDFAVATGLNYAYGTSLYGLKYRGHLQAGETMLVLGAGGAVGLSAVELGVLMGARVIAAASTEEKLDLCRERGRRRDDQLRDREPQGPGEGAHRRRAASTWCTTASAGRTPSRRCGRSRGRAGSW